MKTRLCLIGAILSSLLTATGYAKDQVLQMAQRVKEAEAELAKLERSPPGTVRKSEVVVARAALHEAKAWLAHWQGQNQVELVCWEDVVRVQTQLLQSLQRGGSAPEEIENGEMRLLESRLQVARLKGKSADVIRLLEAVVKITSNQHTRAEKLYAKQAGTSLDLKQKRFAMKMAQERLKAAQTGQLDGGRIEEK